VPMKGDMTHPQIDLGNLIAETAKKAAQKNIENQAQNALQNLLRGRH
jgi:hypothetical protein